MKAGLLSLLIVFILPAVALAAEPPQETLAPVVVTATRTEMRRDETTTSISVITADQIKAQQAQTVAEALRNVPGVDVVQSGSRGNNTSVFIRGSESDHVLVLIDGVEVNSTTLGALNFAHLTTENIERIEVLRGAGGTLYGSQAIGGVINIITRSGAGAPELTLSAAGGNGQSHRQTFALQGQAQKLGYSLSVARFDSRGFRSLNDDYRNLTTWGRLDYKLTEDTSIKGIFRFVKTDLGNFNSNSFIPLPDPNARDATTQIVGKLEWQQQIFKGWDYRIAGSIFKEHNKFTDDPEAGSFDVRTRNRFRPQIAATELQTNYRLGDWSTTTLGVEFKRRKASTSGGINAAVRNLGYYIQEQLRFFDDRLILIPAVRLDDHQTFGTEWSPAFSAAYHFKESGTRLKMGYAESFKAPSLNELFFGPPAPGCPPSGNPDLGPEKSWELNAGVEQTIFGDRVRVGGTFFHREVEDLIMFVPAAPNGCPFTPFRAANVGKARFDGVEWELNVRLLPGLTAGGTYTYLDFDTRDGRHVRRPRHRGSAQINFARDGFQLNFNALITGSRDDFDSVFATIITKGGYTRFDLAGSYALPVKMPLVKELTIFGKIENLLNKKYEPADGFRAPPLNFMLGIRGTFGSP